MCVYGGGITWSGDVTQLAECLPTMAKAQQARRFTAVLWQQEVEEEGGPKGQQHSQSHTMRQAWVTRERSHNK